MDSTTHTTTTVEFVDWRAKAKAKLEAEDKLFKGGRAAKSVQSYVLRTLLGFVDQEPRFAEVVCNTQRTFSECCAAVVNNAGEVLSDLETYRRAVQFYFPNAEVSFSMNIKLTGAPPTEAEMQAPATVKPEDASPNVPKQAAPAHTTKPASKAEKKTDDYFNDYRENLMAVVDGALTARARKRLDKRNAQQAEETEKWFKKVPEPAEVDLKKQILTECYDAVYLWATNTKKLVVTPGGVGKYIPAQQIRCDSCGGEYTLTDRKLKHKSSEICKCCGKKMTVRGTQYSSKRLCAKRTFVWSKKQGTGVWLRKYAVYFGFANHKAKMNIYAEGIWWTDGKEILRWEKRWQNHYTEQKYVMCQNSRLSAALLAPGGYMQPTIIADYGEKVERDLHGVMHTEWLRELDKDLNFYWEIIFWEATLKYPMAESLMKTGWLDAMTDILDGTKTAGLWCHGHDAPGR